MRGLLLNTADNAQIPNFLLESAKMMRHNQASKPSDSKYLELLQMAFREKEIDFYTTVDEIQYKLPYYEGCKYISFPIHHGQVKLLVSEMRFFYEIFKENPSLINKPGIVIYVGSAPGEHIPLLMNYLPNIRFILIDPGHTEHKIRLYFGEFKNKKIYDLKKLKADGKLNQLAKYIIKSSHQANIIPAFCDDELMEELSKIPNIIGMISDIRTVEMRGTDQEGTDPNETDVIINQIMQANWFKILQNNQRARNENLASIYFKFRLPYKNKFTSNDPKFAESIRSSSLKSLELFGFNWYESYNSNNFKKFPYLKARFYIQAYAPIKSTEVRGFIQYNTPIEICDYDITDDFEPKMNFHLSIGRQFCFTRNGNTYDLLLMKSTVSLFLGIINRYEMYYELARNLYEHTISRKKIKWYNYYETTNTLDTTSIEKLVNDYQGMQNSLNSKHSKHNKHHKHARK